MSELDFVSLMSRLALRFPDLDWHLQKVFKKEENCITVFNDGEFVKHMGYYGDIIPNFVIIAPVEFKTETDLLKFTVWIFTTTVADHINARVTIKSNTEFTRTCFIWKGLEKEFYSSLEDWLTNADSVARKLNNLDELNYI